MKRAEAEKVAAVIQGLLNAWTELSEEMNQKRAANWGIINKGMFNGEQMLAKLRTGLDEIEV